MCSLLTALAVCICVPCKTASSKADKAVLFYVADPREYLLWAPVPDRQSSVTMWFVLDYADARGRRAKEATWQARHPLHRSRFARGLFWPAIVAFGPGEFTAQGRRIVLFQDVVLDLLAPAH